METEEDGALNFWYQVVAYGDIQPTIEHAARAESAGFDLLSVPDHLFHPTGSREYLVTRRGKHCRPRCDRPAHRHGNEHAGRHGLGATSPD